MSASIWTPGATPIAVPGLIFREEFIGIASQTLFTLTTFTYTPGTQSLEVYINGQLQKLATDYAETSSASFTLVEGVLADDYITAVAYK